MKYEPVKDHAERKRISALIERCEKEQTMDLIPWDDWIESKNTIFTNAEPTQLACPKCGKRIYKRTDITVTCYPSKHKYFCSKCDWVEYA